MSLWLTFGGGTKLLLGKSLFKLFTANVHFRSSTIIIIIILIIEPDKKKKSNNNILVTLYNNVSFVNIS